MTERDELDNPCWWALTGAQSHLGVRHGAAALYDPELAAFGAVESDEPQAWADLGELLGAGGRAVLLGAEEIVPDGWSCDFRVSAHQMVLVESDRVDAAAGAAPSREFEVAGLGLPDVPEMRELVRLAQPGPFLERTVEFGDYVGVRSGGTLVAMAGTRIRTATHAEVSAVATHPDHVGRGLGAAVVSSVARSLLERGVTPMLHVSVSNARAVALYERLGFVRRTTMSFRLLVPPARATPA